MFVKVIHFAAHTVYLEPMTGQGFLSMPDPGDDLRLGIAPSLQEADWNHVMCELERIGYEPSEAEAEDGGLIYEGTTTNGCPVIGLYGRESILSEPLLKQCADASSQLLRMVGVVV